MVHRPIWTAGPYGPMVVLPAGAIYPLFRLWGYIMEPIIGIDFGTTYSAVAMFQGGTFHTIPNEYGDRVIPSVVYIAETGDIYVGRPAKNVAVLHVDSVVQSVKRELGSSLLYHINGQSYTPERIASFIFGTLRSIAEKQYGTPVKKAVVTVPAYFDDCRRKATRKAAQMAGLEVLRLINEPTAAALAYGFSTEREGKVLVYDLGGGTFDVSILEIREGVFEVIATNGDASLGGDDFDRKIVEVLVEQFREENRIDLKEDRFALQKVYEEAEKAKRLLSEQRMIEIEIPFIAADKRGPLHLTSRMTRLFFEELICSFLDKTIRLVKATLKDAGLKPEDIDRLLLVGGSTRIPLVRKMLAETLGLEPEGSISPEEVVAMGAAVQAGVLSGQTANCVLVDVTPLGLGVENQGGLMHAMIPRNTPIPARASVIFTTVQDYQKAVLIHIIQGERRNVKDNLTLGSFRLEGIREAPKGEPRIEVIFEIDTNGIVDVSAEDLDTRCRYSVTLDNTFRLSEDEVSSMVLDAQVSALDDMHLNCYSNSLVEEERL